MLHSLSVSNIVLIERLTLTFEHGLTVLTGETGAGKSILLDALGLALGSRADFRLIREGEATAQVSAVFHLPTDHPVRTRLAEADIPPDDELILRRRLKNDGKSSASINDVPVSAALLREIGDALKRRCLHLYIPFPDVEIEQRIIAARVPEIPPALQKQLVAFIHELRNLDLKKMPAISETIDWARTLVLLHAEALDANMVKDTLNVILKFQEDIDNVKSEVPALTAKVSG